MARQFANAGIEVKDLAPFQKELRQLANGKAWVGQLRDANAAGGAVIAKHAAAAMRRSGRLGARVAPSVKVGRDARHVVVQLGGRRPKVYQAAWALEFGAKRGRYNFYQRHPWVGNRYERPFGAEVPGHYVGVAARRHADEALEAWSDALLDLRNRVSLFRAAFPD